MARTWLLLSLIALWPLVSCANLRQPGFAVVVDSLAAPEAASKRTYVLLPGNENVHPTDLQFQEYSNYVNRALQSRGFVHATGFDDAEIAVVLFYGIGDPKTTQYTYSLPVWGQTGVSSSQTYGTATTFGGTTSYSGTTTHTPTYGVTGYSTQVGSRTTYFRYAMITGYDLAAYRESQQELELWKTTITSTGSSGDLRRVFPVLLGAAAPHLATNTGQQVSVTLYEDDEIVRAVKGGFADPPHQQPH